MNDTGLARLVSVVIPTHDRAHLLPGAIQSAIGQTYENTEIIIVDDASSDRTSDIVKRFDDPRVRYIRHECNKGGSASRNTGIRNAQGAYIAFLDDDDMWLPTKLERQVRHIESNKHVDAVYTDFLVRDLNTGKIFGRVSHKTKGSLQANLRYENCVGTTSTVLIKRESLGQDLFDENMPSCQDWDMWLRLSRRCSFDCIAEPLVVYSIHDSRISSADTSVLVGRQMILEKHRDDIASDTCALSNHHLRLGSAYCQVGEMNRGREEIRKAIKLRPGTLLGYISYVATFVGSRLYSAFVNMFRVYRYRKRH